MRLLSARSGRSRATALRRVSGGEDPPSPSSWDGWSTRRSSTVNDVNTPPINTRRYRWAAVVATVHAVLPAVLAFSSTAGTSSFLVLAVPLYWTWPLWLRSLYRGRAASAGAYVAAMTVGILAFILGFPLAAFATLMALGGRT